MNLIDVAISPLDDTGWGIGPVETGDVHLFHQLADGTVVDVLNISAYQAEDPDPVDQDDPPFPEESNPYGLTITPEGDALVADAAGNDIIKVTPSGDATTVARFDLELVVHRPPAAGVRTAAADHRRGRAHVGDDRTRRCDLRRPADGLPVPARIVARVAHRPGRRGCVVLGR